MGLFRRSRNVPAREPERQPAVPLTAAEMQVLLDGLRETDRVMREHFWAGGGSGVAAGLAATLLRDAGLAAAQGHHVIPFPVRDLHWLENGRVLMEQNYGGQRIRARYAELLTAMQMLSGMARIDGWHVVQEHGGWCWAFGPCSMPALLASAVAKAS
jgi:hypothetical protein